MSKIISVSSLRNGVGRTTITCLLGLKLAELDYKVLIIDNNYKFCDISNYLMIKPEYSVDDLRPFLKSDMLEKSTLMSMVVQAEKNLSVIPGSSINLIDTTLSMDDILKIKNIVSDEYDYIILDSRAGIDNPEVLNINKHVDRNIIVAQPSKYDYIHYSKICTALEQETIDMLQDVLSNSILIYNRYSDETTLEIENGKKIFGDNIYKVKFCNELIDFCNGYECRLNADTQKVLNDVAIEITQQERMVENKVSTIGKRIKSIFKVS